MQAFAENRPNIQPKNQKNSSCVIRLVTGEHWTGLPNKSIDQIGENCRESANRALAIVL